MAKAATKKTTKTSKTAKPEKGSPSKPVRATAVKLAKTARAPSGKKPAAKAAVSAKKIPAARAPVISKEELRSQIEKLTTANATLKMKNREAVKALKAAEARIAVLEHQIGQSEAKWTCFGKVESSLL
jgi:hypothetical protein